MSPANLVPILAFVTATAGLLAVAQLVSDLVLRDRSRLNNRVDAEFSRKRAEQARKTPLFKNLGQVAASLADPDASPTARQRFEAIVEQSGLDTTPRKVLTLSLIFGAVAGVIDLALRRRGIEAGVACVVAGYLPVWYVRRRQRARLEKLRSQLADAFDLMARVIRAGQTLGQALLAVADEFPEPVASEFGQCYEQQNLGLTPEATFRELTRRTGVIELKIFVLAVLVQQQSGGNLAEILGKLAGIVRERYQLRGTVNTLTAEGRMQGWVLAALPPLMLLLLILLNPTYAAVHLQHMDLLAMTFGVELLGVLWIRKIVSFEF